MTSEREKEQTNANANMRNAHGARYDMGGSYKVRPHELLRPVGRSRPAPTPASGVFGVRPFGIGPWANHANGPPKSKSATK
jgi:hypothetical protein